MRSFISTVVAFVCIWTVFSEALAEPAGIKSLAIGDAAPDFKLPGVDDKEYTLKSLAKSRLLLVIFTCNHCPTAQAYESRIAKLHADYQDRGVALVAISPNDPQAVRLDELGYSDLGDSFEDMKLRAKERKFAFPYLYDGDKQDAALAYGVVATPQVFLFDHDRKLRYVGRIDDSEVKTITSHDTRNALDALLAGKQVPVETTRVFGCSTKWSDNREDARKSQEKWDQEKVELSSLDEAAAAKLARNETDKLLLISVWATWCGPCVAELPELTTINRMYRGRNFQMVTLSIDEPENKEAALKVLQERHVASANYISAASSRDKLADALDKDWGGPIPYTLLVAPGGKIVYRKNGPIDPLTLRRAIVDILGRTYASKPAK